MGIMTIGDLAHQDVNELYKYFKNQASHMIDAANGRDDRPVKSEASAPKGISNSTTLSKDVQNIEELKRLVSQIAENVSIALRKEKKYAYVVGVTLKDNFFRTFSHQVKLKNATDLTSEIRKTAFQLLQEMYHGEAIRLVGVRLDHLVEQSAHQVSLFEDLQERNESKQLDVTIDSLKERFGHDIIQNGLSNDRKIRRKY